MPSFMPPTSMPFTVALNVSCTSSGAAFTNSTTCTSTLSMDKPLLPPRLCTYACASISTGATAGYVKLNVAVIPNIGPSVIGS